MHRLIDVSGHEQALNQAYGYVAAAADSLIATDGPWSQYASHIDCQDILEVLEQNGADVGEGLAFRDDVNASPQELLERAAATLDAIPAGERPGRLGVARMDIAAALVTMTSSADG